MECGKRIPSGHIPFDSCFCEPNAVAKRQSLSLRYSPLRECGRVKALRAGGLEQEAQGLKGADSGMVGVSAGRSAAFDDGMAGCGNFAAPTVRGLASPRYASGNKLFWGGGGARSRDPPLAGRFDGTEAAKRSGTESSRR